MTQKERSWWIPGTQARRDVIRLRDLGSDYPYENQVWNVWVSILLVYFPPYPVVPGGNLYTVRREPYRGGTGFTEDNLHELRPDIVVIQMMPPQPNPHGLDPLRDILWVECKAPTKDTPGGWKDLMEQAGERLRSAHPQTMLYVILAIGSRWMFFRWDPTVPGAQPLQILAHNVNTAWTMDAGFQYEPAVTNQNHVYTMNTIRGQTSVIDTRLAYSLNCWTATPGNPALAQNWRAMLLLQNCLRHIQAT